MSVRDFESIYRRFCRRSDQISEAFLAPTPTISPETAHCDFIHRAGKVQLVNRLLVLWGEYCRTLVIASAFGNALTINGLQLTPAPGVTSLANIKAILGNDFGAGPGTRWEDTNWALQRARRLNPANQNEINLGFGSAPSSDLKLVRNYLIHPNRHTRFKYFHELVPTYSPVRLEPYPFLTNRLPGGSTVLESWIADFQIAAYNAAL